MLFLAIVTGMFLTLSENVHARKVLVWDAEIRGFGGLCVASTGTWNNAKVRMQLCSNQSNQRWRFRDDGKIINLKTKKCLSTSANSVVTHTCNASHQNQVWNTTHWSRIPKGPNAKWIVNSLGVCMQYAKTSRINNTEVKASYCNNNDQQQFITVRDLKPQWAAGVTVNDSDFNYRMAFKVTNDNMCYSTSSCKRRDALIESRNSYIERFAPAGGVYGIRSLNHGGLGRLLTSLAGSGAHGDIEKIYIWNLLAKRDVRNKSSHYGVSQVRFNGINHSGANELVKDNSFLYTNTAPTSNHTVLTFEDSVHGPYVYHDAQTALDRIIHFEKNSWSRFASWGFFNDADASASFRSYWSLKRYYETNSFRVFAETWNGLQREYGENWCPERVWESACTKIGLGKLDMND